MIQALLVSLRAMLTPGELKSNPEAEQFQNKLMKSLEDNFNKIIQSVRAHMMHTAYSPRKALLARSHC